MPPKLFETVELALARRLFSLPPELQLRLSGRPQVTIDGLTLDPSMQLLLTVTRQAGQKRSLSHSSLAVARRRMKFATARYTRSGPSVGSVRDLTIDSPTGPIRARHYAPANASGPEPLLVYLHGGGFALGDLDTHDYPCRVLCRTARVHVLSIAYRLAPECPYPACPDDALVALRYAQAEARALGADPSRVAIGGDSAGGNLSAVIAQRTRADHPPCLQLLIYPVVDRDPQWPSRTLFARGFYLTSEDIDWFDGLYSGSVPRTDPGVSPLRAADLTGLCPTILMTCGFDPLRDEGEAYARALEAAGNRVTFWREPGLIHGFMHVGMVSATARTALERIGTELGRALRG